MFESKAAVEIINGLPNLKKMQHDHGKDFSYEYDQINQVKKLTVNLSFSNDVTRFDLLTMACVVTEMDLSFEVYDENILNQIKNVIKVNKHLTALTLRETSVFSTYFGDEVILLSLFECSSTLQVINNLKRADLLAAEAALKIDE